MPEERASAFKTVSQVADLMQAYRITGNAPFGSQRQPFTQDVVAQDSDDAAHRVMSILGSRHRINRRQITIEEIKEIDPRTSSEPRIIDAFREQIEAAGGPISSQEEE